MTLKLNGSSSGYTAIDAPAAAGSNTLVLPANNGSANQILQTDGSGNLTWVDKPAGISHVDQWVLNTSFTGDSRPIASNLIRQTSTGFGNIGSAMTESSGVFTFPVTGIWRVWGKVTWHLSGTDKHREFDISKTVDNGSNWSIMSYAKNNQHDASALSRSSVTNEVIIDVTDTSNVKVRFEVEVNNDSSQTIGSGDPNHTCFHFIRLGDT